MTEIADTPMAELMAKDPLKLTKTDLDAIIKTLREQRQRFVQIDDKKVGTPAARKTATQKTREKAQDKLKGMNIDDLLNGI